jgi:hypothetical protein
MEQYTQGLPDMYSCHVGFDAILEHSDKHMYGMSSFNSILEFSCMRTPDKYNHHPVDGADDWKRDCVSDDIDFTSVESV